MDTCLEDYQCLGVTPVRQTEQTPNQPQEACTQPMHTHTKVLKRSKIARILTSPTANQLRLSKSTSHSEVRFGLKGCRKGQKIAIFAAESALLVMEICLPT